MLNTPPRGVAGLLFALAFAAAPLAQPTSVSATGSGTGLFGFAGPGQVIFVQPATGTTSQVADLFGPSVQGFLTPLTGDPVTHRLFMGRNLYIDQTVFPAVTAEEIDTIDAVNGAISATSPFLNRQVGPLLFDTDAGTLVGITTDSAPFALVQIDVSTGSETDIASLAGDTFSNFAFAPTIHKAFFLSQSFSAFPPTSQLYVLDTAALTVSAGPFLSTGAFELAYDESSNQLFAITFNLFPFSPARFSRVDTGTGAVTALGTYNFGAYLEPGIAVNSGSHTVYITEDVFDPLTGPITHIASIDDTTGNGVLGGSTNNTIVSLFFITPSVTPDSIISDVKSALATNAITSAGVGAALLAELNQAKAARARGDCATAANIYQAFVKDVTAQNGKAIVTSTASQLIGEALFLIANCP
jgi:hypothetical protein